MFASRMPLTPAIAPDITHAQASTRRIGTPSSPLISRSLANARMASPSLLRLKKTMTPPVIASDRPIAINAGVGDANPKHAKAERIGRQAQARGHSPHINSMKPRMTRAKPSVATARTIGSL